MRSPVASLFLKAAIAPFVAALLASLAASAPGSAQEDRSAEVPGLLVSLQSEEAPVRAAAARTLGEIGAGAQDAVAALTGALRDPDREVRRNAAQALGDIGPGARASAAELIAAVRDADWQVRRAAAYALGRVGSLEAEPALKAARKDDNRAVRDAAKLSLDQLKRLKKELKAGN